MKPNDLYQQGHINRGQGNYAAAIINFNKAIELYTENLDKAEAYFYLALTYKAQGKPAEAITAYTQAIAFYTTNYEKAYTLSCRALVNYQQNQFADAIADYTQSIQFYARNNDKAQIFSYRGLAQKAQGNLVDAMDDFNKSITLSTDNSVKASAYLYRGIIFYEQGNFAAAFTDFNKSISLSDEDSDLVAYYEYRGAANFMLNHLDEALTDFKKTIPLYTASVDKARGLFNHALVNYIQGQFDKACINLTEAISLFKDNYYKALAFRLRGMAHEKQNQFAEALVDFNDAIELFTDRNDQAQTVLNRGIIRYEQDLFAEAIVDFKTSLELFTNANDKACAHHHLGIAYQQQQNNPLAKEHLQLAVQNSQTPYGITFHSRMLLKKLAAAEETSHTIPLVSLIETFAKKPTIKRDDRTLLSIVSAAEQRFDIALEQCKELIKQSSPTLIPRYLREEFFGVILNKAMRPDHAFLKEDIKDLREIKKQLVDLILELKDSKLKQTALAQTLIAATFLGSIFAIPRGFLGTKPSLTSSENKQRVLNCLENEITQHGLVLDELTKNELSGALTAFLQTKPNRVKYPNLYSMLIEPHAPEITTSDESTQQTTGHILPKNFKPSFFSRTVKSSTKYHTVENFSLEEIGGEVDKMHLLHDVDDSSQVGEFTL